MLGVPSALAAVLVIATLAMAAPLDALPRRHLNHTAPTNTTSPFHAPYPYPNSTALPKPTYPATTTHALGFFSWLFGDPLTGSVNFYSRPDCRNPCVTTAYCAVVRDRLAGDLGSFDWSGDESVSCWDVLAGTKGVGLVAGGEGVGRGYVGITVACEGRRGGKRYETREVNWGEGGKVEGQECSSAGDLPEGVKAIVFVGEH